jgi:uncharacterized protein (TIGR02145 family)
MIKRNQLLILLFSCIYFQLISFSQVGIGTVLLNNSAQLELSSSSKGFLIPRMTSSERNLIVNPANGLQIYNISTGCLNYFNLNAWYEVCGNEDLSSRYSSGTIFCSNNPTQIIDVINPYTGKTWMDRNLGANQVATSKTDAAAYGDLYQWGRGNDGHQCRTSPSSSTLSSNDVPGHNFFIFNTNPVSNWRSIQNNNLWQGVNGVNNPCPKGYRIPTSTEFLSEFSTWISDNSNGAFVSILKLTMAGYRGSSNASLLNINSQGYYHTSTVSSNNVMTVTFSNTSFSSSTTTQRASGMSVRCIKN